VLRCGHRTLPIEGVQFHPESVLTQGGHVMLANWLAAYGFAEAAERAPALAAEVEARRLGAFGRLTEFVRSFRTRARRWETVSAPRTWTGCGRQPKPDSNRASVRGARRRRRWRCDGGALGAWPT